MKILLSMAILTFSLCSFSAIKVEKVECVREFSKINCDVNNMFQMHVEGVCWVEGSVDLKDGSTVTDDIYTIQKTPLDNDSPGIYHVNKAIKGASAKSKARKSLKLAIAKLPKCE